MCLPLLRQAEPFSLTDNMLGACRSQIVVSRGVLQSSMCVLNPVPALHSCLHGSNGLVFHILCYIRAA